MMTTSAGALILSSLPEYQTYDDDHDSRVLDRNGMLPRNQLYQPAFLMSNATAALAHCFLLARRHTVVASLSPIPCPQIMASCLGRHLQVSNSKEHPISDLLHRFQNCQYSITHRPSE